MFAAPSSRFALLLVVPAMLFAGQFLRSQERRLPSAEDVKAIQTKFQAERMAAAEQKFPTQGLELSDQLAKRAAAALDGKSFREALRLYREARWQLPYRPVDLPKDVTRIFGSPRMRHGDAISQVAFNPAGTMLASASRDGTVRIWDLGNGREIRAYRGQPFPIRTVAWSPNGRMIASAGGPKEGQGVNDSHSYDIHIWDPADGKLLKTLSGHTALVNSVAFRDDSQALVSGSDDKSIRIWDPVKGSELQVVNQNQLIAQINFVVYSPNGKLIASVTRDDPRLQVWKPDQKPPMQKLVLGTQAHAGGAFQVAFSPDMKALFTCGNEKVAHQHGGTDPDGQHISGTGVRQKNFDAAGGGHNDTITALAISPDGKTLVTGSRDRSIRVWDVASAKVIRTLQGHADAISSLAFSKDGTLLASAGLDQSIRIWNLSSADEHRNFVGHEGYVWSAVFSNNGKLFATGGADKTILIRDTQTGDVLRKIPAHALAVTALAFSPDDARLVSVGGDQLAKLWDVKSGELVREFKGHTSAIMAVAFSGDGKQILTGGADKIARLWDVEKGTVLHTFPPAQSPISAVAIRKDGKQAIIGSADGQATVYDLTAAPKAVSSFVAHLSGIGALAYHPDGTKFVTCGGDKMVKIWKFVESGPATMLTELKGHSNAVSSVAFSADGRLLASGGGDVIVKVWDVQNGVELRSLRGHNDWVGSVAFGPDSRFILSGSVDKTSKIWELSNEETVPPIGHTRKLNTLAVSADGKLLASGSDDRNVKVWNLENGQELYTLAEHTEPVTAVAFDARGERLFSGGDDHKLRIWDLKSKTVQQTIDCDQVAVIVGTSKEDRFLAWFYRTKPNSSTAQIFDKEGKALFAVTERDKSVACLAFTTDGEWVAMGASDGSVRIWDIAKNEQPFGGAMPAHQKAVGDLVFTPDKKMLITGDEEGEIKIWNLAKKEVVRTLQAHKNGLLGITISPDGKAFVTAGQNGELRLWNVETGEKIKEWTIPTVIRGMTFTPDSKKLVTANGDTTLYLIDLPDGV